MLSAKKSKVSSIHNRFLLGVIFVITAAIAYPQASAATSKPRIRLCFRPVPACIPPWRSAGSIGERAAIHAGHAEETTAEISVSTASAASTLRLGVEGTGIAICCLS